MENPMIPDTLHTSYSMSLEEFLASQEQIGTPSHGDEEDHIAHPPIPDLRFEPQFYKTVDALQASGRTPSQIFWVAIVRDQVVMPFLNGLLWGIGAHVWTWMRLRKQRPRGRSETSVLGKAWTSASEWLRHLYSQVVHLPPLIAGEKS